MNNIVVFNAIKAMDRQIERDKEESEEVVKHGYRCLRTGCWLGRTGQCGKKNGRWRKECEWELRGMLFGKGYSG